MTGRTVYINRHVDQGAMSALMRCGYSPVLARLLASRGVGSAKQAEVGIGELLAPSDLKGATEAGGVLARAIVDGKRVCVVADYDCDGASACAIMMRGMRMLGAAQDCLTYLVPDRQKDGYGLTEVIVERAVELLKPDVLVTVDNGIASFEGVQRAIDLGMEVVVTDHHLPASIDGKSELPNATVTVNPSQPGCAFASKALCGAGVAFYVMLMTRSALRAMGRFDAKTQPRLDGLLDLVALATVADVVALDQNNRRLVANGISRMRNENCQPGVKALFEVAGGKLDTATSTDLAFRIGPRVNAAGRLADMRIGIECLTTDDPARATELAADLHRINLERRNVEARMNVQALEIVEKMSGFEESESIVVFDEGFHEGVVGIVAGRLKDREHKPTFVFALSQSGDLKGSGRSVKGFHMRDALDLVAKRMPDGMIRFGGHAMAAGCTIRRTAVDQFRSEMCKVAREWMTKDMRERKILTDGGLSASEFNVRTALDLGEMVWGQAFEAPIFEDEVSVLAQKVLGNKHLKLEVEVSGQKRKAIWFGRSEPMPTKARLVYSLAVNHWNGMDSVEMIVEDMVVDDLSRLAA